MKKRRKKDSVEHYLYGMIMILIGIIGLLHNRMMGFGELIYNFFNFFFGYGAYVIFLIVILSGVFLMFKLRFKNLKLKLVFAMIFADSLIYLSVPQDKTVGMSILTSYVNNFKTMYPKYIESSGGIVGNALYALLSYGVGYVGTIVLLIAICAIALLIFISTFNFKFKKPVTKEIKIQPVKLKPIFVKKEEPVTIEEINRKKEKELKEKEKKELKIQQKENILLPENEKPAVNDKPLDIKPEVKIENVSNDDNRYRYPPIDTILDAPLLVKKTGNQKNAVDKWHTLQTSLESFGLPSTLNNYNIGPSVTQFEIVPSGNFNIRKYYSIQENLKMDMAVMDVRIEAPIPGKKAVGIEIPNAEKIPVRLKEMFNEMPSEYRNNPLAFCVGKDLTGQCVYGLIDKMPHLLVAGQTGSGKSVCMNSILLSILLKAKPQEVKLLLIDPKKVEFKFYEQAPHLVAPIITDTSKASKALEKLVAIMESRYEEFSRIGVRDINEYNAKSEKKMYRIICAIDEIADLMATHRNEVEGHISRLASLARASGIFLILATQRPSTDVITGVIKANIPSRIAFKVTSSYDSRTILDAVGAECLYGNGDMLYNPSGISNPKRIQGVYVSNEEIAKANKYFVDAHMIPKYEDIFVIDEEEESEQNGYSDNPCANDPYYKKVKEWVLTQSTISASGLQRHFSLGFPRAAKMIDALEQEGIISSSNGSKPRDVLVDYDPQKAIAENGEE